MDEETKKILIVDDSEIDRSVLSSILSDDFEVEEIENGYSALEYMQKKGDLIDAILLDVSMPVIDGFSVLRLMRENNIDNIQVFMITSESTKDNVEKAMQYNVADFIKKPFDRETVLKRLKAQLGVVTSQKITDSQYEATNKYIEKLEKTYKTYISNWGKESGHYERMSDLMNILLSRYCASTKNNMLTKREIEFISKAAFFCDIGFMMLPRKYGVMWQDEWDDELYKEHAGLGEDIVGLNTSKECEYFVHLCGQMCAHHHERYDGKGFPDGIYGNNNSIYIQMCRLADSFDEWYLKYRRHNDRWFDLVISSLSKDRGMVSPEVFSLLIDSRLSIISYYDTREEDV